MPLWSNKQSDKPVDPDAYFPRAQKRMRDQSILHNQLLREQNGRNPNRRKISDLAQKIQGLAQEHKNKVNPDDRSLIGHKRDYFRFIDLQARIAEDEVKTCGENYKALTDS